MFNNNFVDFQKYSLFRSHRRTKFINYENPHDSIRAISKFLLTTSLIFRVRNPTLYFLQTRVELLLPWKIEPKIPTTDGRRIIQTENQPTIPFFQTPLLAFTSRWRSNRDQLVNFSFVFILLFEFWGDQLLCLYKFVVFGSNSPAFLFFFMH